MEYSEFKQQAESALKEIQVTNDQLWQNYKDLYNAICKLRYVLKEFETYPYYKRQLESEITKLHKCWVDLNMLAATVEVSRSTLVLRITLAPEESTHKLLEKKEVDGRSNDDK